MAKYYSSLRCKCDVKDCTAIAEFKNADRLPAYQLDWLAIAANWYIALYGDDLCPKHHRERAGQHGWPSLYAEPVLRTVQHGPAAPKRKKEV